MPKGIEAFFLTDPRCVDCRSALDHGALAGAQSFMKAKNRVRS
jgi:hypothetical protein